MLKAKSVKALPGKSTPWHSGTVTMLVYRDTPADDATRYQWQKKDSGGSSFVNINGATKAEYEMKGTGNSDAGSYRCTVTFADGTTTNTTTEVVVGRPKVLVAGANKDTFHKAHKLYRGDFYITHARWDAIDKLVTLCNTAANDNAEKFRDAIARDKDLAHIYDILERYGSVKFIDSRSGYTYIIDENTSYTNKMVVEGPFKNMWPAP